MFTEKNQPVKQRKAGTEIGVGFQNNLQTQLVFSEKQAETLKLFFFLTRQAKGSQITIRESKGFNITGLQT